MHRVALDYDAATAQQANHGIPERVPRGRPSPGGCLRTIGGAVSIKLALPAASRWDHRSKARFVSQRDRKAQGFARTSSSSRKPCAMPIMLRLPDIIVATTA
jgi:hypothetical protein